MDSADWDREGKVDLYNPFYCSKHFIRARTRNGGKGKIIDLTSIHQTVPRAGASRYDVAKDREERRGRYRAARRPDASDEVSDPCVSNRCVSDPCVSERCVSDPYVSDPRAYSDQRVSDQRVRA